MDSLCDAYTLPTIETLHGRQLILVPLHQVGELEQERSSLVSWYLQAPSRLESLSGGLDGSVDVFLSSMGDVHEVFACGWIDGLESLF